MASARMAANSLTLESYIQLHQALTKHGQVVQSVTPIEECYYKIADLRQFLQLHGFAAAGKFNRAELLAAIRGQKLINPFSGSSSSIASGTAASKPPEADRSQHVATDTKLPFTAADVCSVLGMQGANPQELHFLPLGPAASSNAAAKLPCVPATDQDTPPEDTPISASGNAAVGAAVHPAPAAPAPTASQQVHPSTSRSQHQQQQAGAFQQHQQPIQTQQATATANAPPLLDCTSHTQQQHQAQQQTQVLQTQHAEAAAGPSAAALQSSSLALGDPLLQQLLARLLTQHAAGSAPASQTLTQQHQQQQQQPGHNHQHHNTVQPGPSSASDLIAQLLARGTGPAHSTGLPQPANPASSTATLPTAPPSVGTAAAPSDTPAAQQQPQAEEVPTTPAPTHTPWLRPQLQWLADNGLHVANPAAAAVRCRGDGLLQGCRVGFVLLEAMQVAGARNTLLTLPAGFYEVRAGAVCY